MVNFLVLSKVTAGESTHFRTDVVLKECRHEFIGGFLKQNHHRLVQRVSVLIQPAGDIVRHLQ